MLMTGASAISAARIFGFVARKIGSRTDNACHVFAEFDPEQPATAVVNFITKVSNSNAKNYKILLLR
jgi:tensin